MLRTDGGSLELEDATRKIESLEEGDARRDRAGDRKVGIDRRSSGRHVGKGKERRQSPLCIILLLAPLGQHAHFSRADARLLREEGPPPERAAEVPSWNDVVAAGAGTVEVAKAERQRTDDEDVGVESGEAAETEQH